MSTSRDVTPVICTSRCGEGQHGLRSGCRARAGAHDVTRRGGAVDGQQGLACLLVVDGHRRSRSGPGRRESCGQRAEACHGIRHVPGHHGGQVGGDEGEPGGDASERAAAREISRVHVRARGGPLLSHGDDDPLRRQGGEQVVEHGGSGERRGEPCRSRTGATWPPARTTTVRSGSLLLAIAPLWPLPMLPRTDTRAASLTTAVTRSG